MAVALGVAGATVFGAGINTLTTASYTVGSGITALLGVLAVGAISGNPGPSSPSCAWNTTGTMAQIVGPVSISGAFITSGATYFFWIANPAQTTSTATVSWANNCQACFALISFSGTDTVTPFINPGSSTGTGGTASTTITVPPNGGAVAMGVDCSNFSGGMTGTGVTPWFLDQNVIQTATGYGFGSTNLTFNVPDSGAPNGVWSVAGVGIQSPPSVLSPRRLIMY